MRKMCVKLRNANTYPPSASGVPSACALGNSLDLLLVFPCTPLLLCRCRLSTVMYKTLQYIIVYCIVLQDSAVVLSRKHYSSVRHSLQKVVSSFISIICPNTQQYYCTPLLLHDLQNSCISVLDHYSTPVLLHYSTPVLQHYSTPVLLSSSQPLLLFPFKFFCAKKQIKLEII